MDSVLERLREADFSTVMTHHAFHTLENHIVGYTLQEVNSPFDNEELAELGAIFLRELPAEE